MKKFKVWIPDPLTVNKMYVPLRSGVKILSEDGRKYRGEWRDALKRKSFADFKRDYIASHGKAEIFEIDGYIFIEGRLGKIFRKSGIRFPAKTKVVIEARGFWKDEKKRDMSNMQKPIEDAFQDAGCMPDDSFLLWRNIDFEYTNDDNKHGLELTIYALVEGR